MGCSMTESKVSTKDLLIRNPDVILREEDAEGALLFNPDTNQIRVINPTGLFIWKQCDSKKNLPAIVSALKDAFEGVPEKEVDGEVKAFVDDMRANGFLGVSIGKLNPRKKTKKQ